MVGKRILVKMGGKYPLIPYICYAIDDGFEYYICISGENPKIRIQSGLTDTIITITS